MNTEDTEGTKELLFWKRSAVQNSAELKGELTNSFVPSVPSVLNPSHLAYFSYAHID